MEFGISLGLSPREDIDRLVRVVRAAEEADLAAAWVIDSQLAMKDAYLTLAVLARSTSSIRLGPGVTNLVTRDVTVVANAMATLESFAPGRVDVGVGAGDSSVIPLGVGPLPVATLEERTQRLRALLAGDAVEGPTGELRLSFAPEQPPPIYLSASQPRMLRLAGRIADGVIIMGPADVDTVREQMQHVDDGAIEAGRKPSSVRRDLWVTMAVGDEREALADVKSWASAQARWLTTWQSLPPSLERFRDEMKAAKEHYDFGAHLARRAGHAGEVSDELAAALAVAGSVEVCAQRLGDLATTGPDRLTVTLLSGGRERRLQDVVEVTSEVASSGR